MPIKIFDAGRSENSEIAWLCDECWSLPEQIEALKRWVNSVELPPAEYVADIGFTIRPEAFGGGAALEPDFLRALADSGISIFLSEYPSDWAGWTGRRN